MTFIDAVPVTYAQLAERVEGVSSFLRDEGIVKGDKVAILSENHPNWGIAFFGITSIGAVAVPIMQEFHTSEVQHILRHSEAKAIFVSSKYLQKLEDGGFENLHTMILMEDYTIIPPNFDSDILRKFITESKKGFAKIKNKALIKLGLVSDGVVQEDLASLIYTSGTTGHSKGVMLTHQNLVSNVKSVTKMTGVTSDDSFLSILPLSHTIECTLGLLTPLYNGCSVYYLDGLPNAATLLPALQKVKPTVMLSVPLIIEKIFKMRIQPKFKESAIIRSLYKFAPLRKKINQAAGKKLYSTFGGRLRMFCIGGAPLAEDVEKFLKEAKFPYTVGYGLTETSPLVTGNPAVSYRYRSVGQPIPEVSVKIADPDEKTGEGEILVKGPSVMKGYYKHPDKTAEVFTEDGWFKTGDLGTIGKDGYVYIKGRIKNMILGPNGKNIYPEIIEALINEFKYVLESLVVEKDKALVAKIHLDYKELDNLYSSKNLSETEIQQEIKKILEHIKTDLNIRLPSFSKLMQAFEQTIPFEKTPTLKIKRHLYV